MSTVFIFHGIGGNHTENWFPWLKEELEQKKLRVIVPDFPNAETPDCDAWMKHMEKYEESLNEESVIVGHSLGGIFALRLLEHLTHPVKATFLVASVTGPTDGRNYQPLMTIFTTKPLDWAAIRKNGGKFHILHADNDPFISLQNAEALAQHLDTAVTLIPGGGHLNQGSGYTEFPRLRDMIFASIIP